MARFRKTFSVMALLDRANYALLNTPDDRQGERNGWIAMIEGVLMDSGCYQGFRYLNQQDMLKSAEGVKPAYQLRENGEQDFDGGDHTRVRYYVDHKLQD